MDTATILGLLLAWGAVTACVIVDGSSLGQFLDIPALLFVLVGTIAVTAVASSLSDLRRLPSIVRCAFAPLRLDSSSIVTTVTDLARVARKSGVLALEAETVKIHDRFLRSGIRLVIDGVAPEVIRELLETEIVSLHERHSDGADMLSTMGRYAPAIGILGTLIALVTELHRLTDPAKMGASLAQSLVPTLYGIAFTNLVFLPIGSKLKTRTSKEAAAYDMIMEGVLSIQAGDSPRIVEAKMLAFLPPNDRRRCATVSLTKD